MDYKVQQRRDNELATRKVIVKEVQRKDDPVDLGINKFKKTKPKYKELAEYKTIVWNNIKEGR